MNGRVVEGLYRRYERCLLRYGLTIIRDEHAVRDAIQDVFLRLIHRVNDAAEVDNPKTYLFVALRNQLVKESTTRKNHRHHDREYSRGQVITVEPTVCEGDEEQQRKLGLCLRAIDGLPERERTILSMRYLEGYDYKEISTVTRSNHQVTRNTASKAIKRVRREVRDHATSPVF
jgi:RNA polymerase sigma factor (sigma-70 family)